MEHHGTMKPATTSSQNGAWATTAHTEAPKGGESSDNLRPGNEPIITFVATKPTAIATTGTQESPIVQEREPAAAGPTTSCPSRLPSQAAPLPLVATSRALPDKAGFGFAPTRPPQALE